MSFLTAVWRFAVGGDKDVAAGQKALGRIHRLLTKAMSERNGAPRALTLEQIAPIRAICDQLSAANCNANCLFYLLCVCVCVVELVND